MVTQPSESAHPNLEHLLPAQHAAQAAALQLWENAWKDTVHQVAVMADCLQSVVTCLGINKDIKSALASANGATEVQSIAASVVEAVTSRSALQHKPEEAAGFQQSEPHELVGVVKLEDNAQSHELPFHNEYEPRTANLAAGSFQHPLQAPSNAVPFPLHDATQPSSDGPRAAHALPMSTAYASDRFDATRAVHDTHAHDSATVPLQPFDRNTGQSALGHATTTRMQQPHRFSSPPADRHGLQPPLQSPNGNMLGKNQAAQPYMSPEHAQLHQSRSPLRPHGTSLEAGCGTVVGADHSTQHSPQRTPPRPAALLRETCLATPVSQRPPDAFHLCAQSQLRDSAPGGAAFQGVDQRTTGPHEALHRDRKQGAAARAVFNAPATRDGCSHTENGARGGGAAAFVGLRAQAAVGGAEALMGGEEVQCDEAFAGCMGEPRPRAMCSGLGAGTAAMEVVTRAAGSPGAVDVKVEDLGDGAAQHADDEAQEEDEVEDEGDRPKAVCWRVLGAPSRAKPDQVLNSRAAEQRAHAQGACNVQQLPPQPVDCGHDRTAWQDGGGEAACATGHLPIQNDKPVAPASHGPAYGHLRGHEGRPGSIHTEAAGAGTVAATFGPAARGAGTSVDVVRADAGAADGGKGKRKAGGVWKSRKANILVGKQARGKPSGRIDRMLSHINVPRSQQGTKRPAVAVERHAHAPIAVAPVAVKGLAGDDGSEENLERRRLEVHADQAGAHEGGPRVYDERVRKRAEREALPAWECQQCARFYAMLKRQGYNVDNDALKCPDCGDDRRTDWGGNGDVQGILQETSRHRHRFVAPPTPKNFWAIGFDDDWGKGNRRGGQ